MGLAGLSASPAFLKGVKMELNIQTAELALKEAAQKTDTLINRRCYHK